MKKLIKGILFGAFVVLAATKAQAADYTLDLTTNVPNASLTEYNTGSYPNRSGGLQVRQIILANSGATVQTVSVWDTATSTTAATLAAKFVVPTTGTYVYEFPAATFRLTSPSFNKSATGSSVQLNLIYQ